MPFGSKVRLGPDHILLDGDPALSTKGAQRPGFWPMSVVAKWSPILAVVEGHFVQPARLLSRIFCH